MPIRKNFLKFATEIPPNMKPMSILCPEHSSLRASLPTILIIVVLLLSGGCKTTVKNYKDAYDIAREKRERDELRHRQLQDEVGVERDKLENVDEMPINRIEITNPSKDSDKLQLKAVRAAFHREDKVFGVVAAVAKFKMRANATSLAEDLRSEGFPDARSVRSGEDFYVIIADGALPAELAPAIFKFRKKLPDFPYVGQGEMLLIYAN